MYCFQQDMKRQAIELRRFWQQVQPKIANSCERYSEPVMLRHYEHVSSKLWDATGDWDLALAGYLHGISDIRSLGQLLTPEQNDVVTIIEERRRMMSLNPDDPEVSDRLISGFLPRMRDVRSLILLVV